MSKIEIQYQHTKSVDNLYFTLQDSTGNYYDITNDVFEAYSGTWADYDTALTHVATNRYTGELDSALFVKGYYLINIFLRIGASPNLTNDILLSTNNVYYDPAEIQTLQDSAGSIDNGTLYEAIKSVQADVGNIDSDLQETGFPTVSMQKLEAYILELDSRLTQLELYVKAIHSQTRS